MIGSPEGDLPNREQLKVVTLEFGTKVMYQGYTYVIFDLWAGDDYCYACMVLPDSRLSAPATHQFYTIDAVLPGKMTLEEIIQGLNEVFGSEGNAAEERRRKLMEYSRQKSRTVTL